MLVPHLTVAENIFLGREPANKIGFRDVRAIFRRAQQMVDQIGVDIDVRRRVEELTIAQQQLVEIVKEVSFEARILVMDEPTSSLEENEVRLLFQIIRRLKSQAVSIIYISHKMDEILEISDRVTVIRDGYYVGTRDTVETNADELVKLMVGRSFSSLFTRSDVPIGDEVIRVEGLTRKGVFSDITFSVHKGEVLGFTGLVGAGRSEIMRALFGVDRCDKGQEMCIRDSNQDQSVEEVMVEMENIASDIMKHTSGTILAIGIAVPGPVILSEERIALVTGKVGWKNIRFRERFQPVSYTHLDVYKRQIKSSWRE